MKGKAEAFKEQLADPLATGRAAVKLIADTIQAALDSPPPADVRARNVTLKLLTRISRDLRCALDLIETGYPVQALSLVTTVLEVAFTTAYIRDDDQRAQDWFDHDDPTRTFGDVVSLIDDVISRIGVPNPSELVNKHYSTYRQLCMAKHANPELEKSFGIREEAGAIVFGDGPMFDETAFRMAWYALTNGTGLASMAIGSVLERHVAEVRVETLREQLSSIGERVQAHTQEALSRRWDKDPYPGRWRPPR